MPRSTRKGATLALQSIDIIIQRSIPTHLPPPTNAWVVEVAAVVAAVMVGPAVVAVAATVLVEVVARVRVAVALQVTRFVKHTVRAIRSNRATYVKLSITWAAPQRWAASQ
jgi:hypothetical protein